MKDQVYEAVVGIYAYPSESSRTGYNITVCRVSGYTPDEYVLVGEIPIETTFNEAKLIAELKINVEKQALVDKEMIDQKTDEIIGRLTALPAPKEELR